MYANNLSCFLGCSPRVFLHDDWNANFAKKLRKLRKLKTKNQFNTCVSCAGEPYQNSGDFENVTVRSMLRFPAGMAKPKNVLFNLRNLRNFFLKFAFQYPSTKYQQSISGNTPAYFWLFHATQALCVNNVAGIHSQDSAHSFSSPHFQHL